MWTRVSDLGHSDAGMFICRVEQVGQGWDSDMFRGARPQSLDLRTASEGFEQDPARAVMDDGGSHALACSGSASRDYSITGR